MKHCPFLSLVQHFNDLSLNIKPSTLCGPESTDEANLVM